MSNNQEPEEAQLSEPSENQASSAAKSVAQNATKKAKEKIINRLKKSIKSGAAKHSVMAALGPILLWAFVIIVIIIVIIGIAMFLVTMPGMVMDQLKTLFKNIANSIASWFGEDSTTQVDYDVVYDTIDYLNEMGYDIKGYGFLTSFIEDESDLTDSQIDDIGDDKLSDVVYEDGVAKIDDKVVAANSDFILTYLISDNYTYTIKNKNLVTKTKVGAFFQHVGDLFGHFSENKTSGLIAVYNEGSDGLGDRGSFFSDTGFLNFKDMYIKDKTFTIKKSGILNRNNYMSYSLDGWTGRYGMPVDFLLSVHVATLMPDLAYDMVKSFGTQINLILHQVDEADVESSFLTDSGQYVTYGDFDNEVGFSIGSSGCSKKDAMNIMKKFGINSQTEGTYACTGSSDTTYVVYPTSYDGWTASEAHEKLDNWNDFVTNRDKLEKDYDANKYKDWASLYDYIYSSGKKNDDGSYQFVYPASLHENAAFSLGTLKQMIHDCYDYWEYCNNMTGDNQTNPFSWNTYTFEGMKGFDDYAELSIPTLIDASSDSEYAIDLGTWTKTTDVSDEGESDDVDYTLELVISTKQGDDNWVYSLVVYRDLTEEEMEEQGISLNGADVCSNSGNKKACKRCRKYIRAIYKILKKVDDDDFDYYIPYIENVTDHWYRDVYFTETKYDSNNKKVSGSNSFVTTDAEYESIYNERWTLYETYDETGEYKYYALDNSGNYATSTTSIENYNSSMFEKDGSYYRLKSEYSYSDATDANIVVAKKAETISISDTDALEDAGWNKSESAGIWTAYDDSDTISTDWEASYPDSQDPIKSKIYYKFNSTMTITQTGEGQRTETNSKIKKMFLSNNYFRYDGSEETAEIITALRNNNNIEYGALSDSDLKKTATITSDDGETKTYTVKDYAGKVSLEQDSLNAFSMLENTHTLDADYIYRDFKELIVELGYFTKEELTDEAPKLLQWIIPDIGSYGFPDRSIDKKENEYGTEIHSKGDINANKQYTIMQKLQEFLEAETESDGEENTLGASGSTLDSVSGVSNISLKSTISTTSIVGALDGDKKPSEVSVSEFLEAAAEVHSRMEGDVWEYCAAGTHSGSSTRHSQIGTHTTYSTYSDAEAGVKTADCSSYVSWVLQEVGIIKGKYSSSAMYTALAEYILTKDEAGELQPGDILLADGHVQINGENNMQYNAGSTSAIQDAPKEYVPDFYTHVIRLFNGTVSGSGGTYEGYEGNEAVVSPVTGILLEYGTYDDEVDSITGEEYRVNADIKYGNSTSGSTTETGDSGETSETGESGESNENIVHDKVGYAKILVLDAESYQKLEANTSNSWQNDSLVSIKEGTTNEAGETSSDKVTFTEILTGDRSKDKSKTPNKSISSDDDYNKIFEDWTNLDKTVYGYKEFAERYEKAGIAGYIIYIDGFICETPSGSASSEDSTTGEETSDTGETTSESKKLTLDDFKKITESDLTGTDEVTSENLMESKYEKDDTYKLSSQKMTDKLNAETEIKDEANSTLYVSTGDLVFIKEGTVLGRTMTDEELIEDVRKEKDKTYDYYRSGTSSTEGDSTGSDTSTESTENTDKVMGNYVRIIMRDLDDTVVENVEDYMKLDDEAGGSTELSDDVFLQYLDSYESGAVYDYLYGDASYTSYVSKYITEDKQYFICYNDGTGKDDRNFGFGILHYLNSTYQAVDYYSQVGITINDGSYIEIGVSKCPVDKVLEVQKLIIEGKRELVISQIGQSNYDKLTKAQQDCLVDIAYQGCSSWGALKTLLDNGASAQEVVDSWGRLTSTTYNNQNRADARKTLWLEGKYIDSSGNEIK